MWLKMMWKDKESGKKKPGRYSETQRQVFSQNAGKMLVTWLSVVANTRKSWKTEVGGTGVQGQPQLHGEFEVSPWHRRPCLEKKKCENVFKRYHWEVGHIRAAAERAESYSWNWGMMMSEWDPAAEHNCDLFVQLGGWGMNLEAQSSFSCPLSLSPSRLASLPSSLN